MKANEFIKKFGLDSFKVAMLCPQFKRYNYAILYSDEVDFSNEFIEKHTDYMFKTSDLKRLVESHELVEIYTRRFNGDAEWFFVSEYCKKNRISPFFSENYNKASGIYKQAILDVEPCQ